MSERITVNRCECLPEDRKPHLRNDEFKTELCITCYEVISYEKANKIKPVKVHTGEKKQTKAEKTERKASIDEIKLPSEEVRLLEREYNFEVNKVYLEKCEATMARMKDGEVDYVFTSPPYNVAQTAFAKYGDYSDDKSQQEYLQWIIEVIDELLRVTKQHVFFNIQELANNRIALDCLMYHYRYKIKEKFIWRKASGSQATNSKVCSSRWEYIWCLSNQNPLYKAFEDVDTLSDWTNVIEIKNQKNKHAKDHKAVFPINLPRKFIEKFGKEGDIWYDPFMGTGTTARACIRSGRKFVGSEMSKKVHSIAIKEINNTLINPTLDFLEEVEYIEKPKIKTVYDGGKHPQIIMEI